MQAVERPRTAFLILSGLALAGAFAWEVRWVPALVILAILGLLLRARRSSQLVMSPGFLGGYVTIAAAGMYLELSGILLILGTCSAVASWDLAYFAESAGPAEESKSWRALVRAHNGALAVALAGGLLSSFIGSGTSLRLPFGLVVAVALIFFASTAAAFRQFRHNT